jgi:hypothetical protein
MASGSSHKTSTCGMPPNGTQKCRRRTSDLPRRQVEQFVLGPSYFYSQGVATLVPVSSLGVSYKMKIAMMKSLLLLELAVAASGFVSPRFPSSAATLVVLRETVTSSAVASDFGTAMPTEVNPYEKIGIQEHQLALGTNPEDLYQYVGT